MQEVGERYGCMKGGVEDIKKHRWYGGFDFAQLLKMTITAPYIPPISYKGNK